MDTLVDYIRWYADLSFYEKPFGDVDNLVLSTLAYYRFDRKRTDERPVSVRRCVTDAADNDSFLSAVIRSRRFGSLMVSDVSEIFSRDRETQFAAMKFHLYDNLYYIAFRGTDNSLVGWKEDFVMSYKITDAQHSAVRYLDQVIEEDKEYLIGGHSKGGNLSLYGACMISDEKRGRIRHIYNNDGPGLCPEVSDVALIDKLRDRITVILPEYCIFGRIFAHDIPDTKIVTSSYSGINEHDLVSWGVKYGGLDTVSAFDPGSLWINDVAAHWLRDVSPAEREALVNSVFAASEKRGEQTYTEAMQVDVDKVEDLVKNVVESDSLMTVAKIPEKALFGDMLERLRTGKLATFINANELAEGVVFAVVGLLMVIFPQWSFQLIIAVLLGGVVLFQLGYTIKKLYESRWNFVQERTRVYIFVVIATLFAIVLVKKQAIFIVGSGIAGGWLLVVAYKSFLVVKRSKTRNFACWKSLVKSILYTGCGVFIMIAPLETLRWFMLALGSIMVIDGICTIVYSFFAANDKYSKKHHHRDERT